MLRHYETTDGVSLVYREWAYQKWAGRSDPNRREETILFLHGLGADGRQFEADALALSAQGYRVLVPDLRGHGLSTAPHPVTRETLDLEALAADLHPLLKDRVDQPLHLVGNSLGGLVALKLCERYGDRISSLCTFGTTYHLSYPPGVAELQYGLSRLLGRERLAKLVARQATAFEAARPLLRDMYRTSNPRIVRRIQQNIRAYDVRPLALDYSGPILFLSAEQDTAINRQSASTLEILRDKPGFRPVEIAQAGHFANLDQPDAFRAALIAFWESVAKP